MKLLKDECGMRNDDSSAACGFACLRSSASSSTLYEVASGEQHAGRVKRTTATARISSV